MGKLRTANNRRNRAIRHSTARAQVVGSGITTGETTDALKTKAKPAKKAVS